MNTIKDTSIFQGWKEWTDAYGNDYRAEYKRGQRWNIYIKKGNSFIFETQIQAHKKSSAKHLHSTLEEETYLADYNEEAEHWSTV